MGSGSKIEWTETTWNPITGCSKISPGCTNCYAEKMAKRLHAMGQPNYANGFEVSLHEKSLLIPLSLKKPQTIFVNSMSDLFHEKVPLEFIKRVFDVMERACWHRFQVLTKRSDRLLSLSPLLNWPENVWMGVSVENDCYNFRIDHLRSTKAKVKFLSCEPLIGPLGSINLNGIDWVIVGGESGPGSRPIKEDWVIEIRDQCRSNDVPFFFKQWGGVNKKKTGRLLDGKIYDEIPEFTPCTDRNLSFTFN